VRELIYNNIYVLLIKTTFYFSPKFKKNLVNPNHFVLNYHRSFDYQRSNLATAGFYLPFNINMRSIWVKTKNFSRKINNCFIYLLLFLFYLAIVGFSYFLYFIFSMNKGKKEVKSYWLEPENKELSEKYFLSPY
jgi:hypothetical protein